MLYNVIDQTLVLQKFLIYCILLFRPINMFMSLLKQSFSKLTKFLIVMWSIELYDQL